MREEPIDMAPMIDMVFLLLVFFMVASHLNQLDKVDIDVPIAKNAAVPKELADRRTITVKKDGVIYVGNVPRKLNEVGPIIKKTRQTIPGLKIYLRGDAQVEHKHIRDVMKACAENGAAEIIFGTFEK